jgi:hypothetical protein
MHDRAYGLVFSRPSQFLEDIPRPVLRPVRLVEEPSAG